MTQLASTEIPDCADVVVTSRASHHLDSSGLAEFYRAACGRLAPGGWLFNLDHVGLGAPWDRRLLEVREHLFGASGAQSSGHRHDRLLPSVRDHLDALAASDFGEFDMPWRAFRTCLFAARKRSAPATLVR